MWCASITQYTLQTHTNAAIPVFKIFGCMRPGGNPANWDWRSAPSHVRLPLCLHCLVIDKITARKVKFCICWFAESVHNYTYLPCIELECCLIHAHVVVERLRLRQQAVVTASVASEGSLFNAAVTHTQLSGTFLWYGDRSSATN